jgi:Bardet-Biedl syndrome 5 protein
MSQLLAQHKQLLLKPKPADFSMIIGENELVLNVARLNDDKYDGKFIITNVRMLYVSVALQLIVGLSLVDDILLADDEDPTSANSFTVTVSSESSKQHEFKFTVSDRSKAELLKQKFSQILENYRSTNPLRELLLRIDNITSSLLTNFGEKTYSTWTAWNVSMDQGTLGKIMTTNYRVIWHSMLDEKFNISVSYLLLGSIQLKTSKFGRVLAIECKNTNDSNPPLMLGFRIDNGLETCCDEINKLKQVYSKNPTISFSKTAVTQQPQPTPKAEPIITAPVLEAPMLRSRLQAASKPDDSAKSDAPKPGRGIPDDVEFCPEIGLYIKKLPEGVTYASLWEVA